MALPDLFIVNEEESKALSLITLPQDADMWPEVIVTKLKEKIPEVKHNTIRVSFISKDDETGMATGAAAVNDQKLNKTIYVPIIIKDFKLFPLDVLLVPKEGGNNGLELIPFTKENYEESLFNNEVFDHLSRPMDRIQQMYLNPQNTVAYPPYHRNVYASVSGQVLESVLKEATKEELTKVSSFIRSNKELLNGYEENNTLPLIQKIAECSGKTKESPKGKISFIKKASDNSLKVCYTEDKVFNPIVKEYKIKNHADLTKIIHEFCGDQTEEALHDVMKNGETIIYRDLEPLSDSIEVGPESPMSDKKFTDTANKIITPKILGVYKVYSKNGILYKGAVIPNVINFDREILPSQLFITKDKYSYTPSMAAILQEDSSVENYLCCSTPSIGDTGVFAIRTKTNALSTIPFTVRSSFHQNGFSILIVETFEGRRLKIKYNVYNYEIDSSSNNVQKDIDDKIFKEIVKTKDFYLVPDVFKFYKLGTFLELIVNPKDLIEAGISKLAGYQESAPVKLIHTGYGQYALKGGEVQKIASAFKVDPTNLSGNQAAFFLMVHGCPIEKVASAIKIASSGGIGAAVVRALPKLAEEGSEAYALYKNKKKKSKEKKASLDLSVNLIKEAAKLEDAQTVDAALSLNFINSENLGKFISFIPYFKECSKMLAQALLASRLGVKEIPEQETQSIMFKLLDVVKGLERLKDKSDK